MLSAVRPVRSLLLAIFMLMAGAGFIGTLVSLRLEGAGANPLLIGLVATAYFAGLTVGSLRGGAVVQRVGHIRAFAAFVALLSASTLSYSIHQGVAFWAVLRLVDGLCVAGVYVCLESWLNDRVEGKARGSVLAAYMIALYAGQALGQFLLNLGGASADLPLVAASILISLAIIPIALTRSMSPTLGEHRPVSIRRLYQISPLGLVGAAVTGLMLGAFYGLGAVYARRLGMDVAATSIFMSAVIAGGVALQWPLGWLSDRFDRRSVILAAFLGAAAVSGGIALTGAAGGWLLLLAPLFGGLSFALYPLCVAHANDHIEPQHRVGASGGLVLIYSAGAAAGPLMGAGAMGVFGAGGLFWSIAACSALACVFSIWRQWMREPVPKYLQRAFQALPRTTPVSAVLDPLAPDEGRTVEPRRR